MWLRFAFILYFVHLSFESPSPPTGTSHQEAPNHNLEPGPDQSAIVSIQYAEADDVYIVTDNLLSWDDHPAVVARANFTNAQQETGWMYLEVETRESAPDSVQARAAGIAEGYLTRHYQLESYKEFYANDACAKEPDACEWIQKRFKENDEWISQQVESNKETDPYWHQVGLFFHQLDGMREGFERKSEVLGVDNHEMDLDMGFKLTLYIADFWDLIEQYRLLFPTAEKRAKRSAPSCSVVIKYIPEREDILFAHNTWHEYRAMSYRFLKNYRINVHTLPDSNEVVPGHTISMSSYAGSIASLDDFYLLSSGLAATETTLFIYDKELYRQLQSVDVVFEPIRVMVANRLATDAYKWQETFKQFNSGTYNNEWMVVDYNILKKSPTELLDGVLVVSEQMPGKSVIHDQTHFLKDPGYWKSYNRAFYPEIHEFCGGNKMVSEFGDWFTHDLTPRSKIIDREQQKVHDLDSLMTLMRFNKFDTDPLALVDGCTPKRTPAGSIANRLDLSDPEGNCSFSDVDWMIGTKWGYGCLDAKLASKSSFPRLEFLAVAGPTHDDQPVFEWSTSSLEDKPEFRPIDRFEFYPFNITWEHNGAVNQQSALLIPLVAFLALVWTG